MEKYQRINTICLFSLTLMALAFVLAVTKAVMIPFVLSLFLYFILTPVTKWLQTKLKLKRWASLLLTFFLFGASIALISWLMSYSIDSFVKGIDQYKERVDFMSHTIESGMQKFGFDFSKFNAGEKSQLAPILPTLRKLTTSLLGILSNSVLVIIFTLFLLTGEGLAGEVNQTIEKVKSGIARYVTTKLFMSLATGGLSYLVFLIFDVELASMLAILTVLLNFIPNIGSIVAVLLPIPVLLLQFYLGWESFVVISLLTSFQVLIGNVIEPKVMGDSMGLHPVFILLSLAFWGFIWGIPGMFLSVPIMASLKIVFESFEFTSPMGRWMEGKLS